MSATCDCGRPSRDAVICRRCQILLCEALDQIRGAIREARFPWEQQHGLAEDIDLAITRQTRIGSRAVGSRSTDTPLPYDWRASEVGDWLKATLRRWQAELIAAHPAMPVRPATSTSARAAWIADQLPTLCKWPETSKLLADVLTARDMVQKAVDLPPVREFIGTCPSTLDTGEECATELYVEAEQVKTECRTCGVTWVVGELKARALKLVHDQLATASTIARGIELLGEHVTPERIRKWAERGRIAARPTWDPAGKPLYRVGDVLKLLSEDAHSRHQREVRAASRRVG